MNEKKPTTINGIKYWKCPTCGLLIDESGFYKSKKTKNGLYSQCKKCHTAGSLRTRDKNRHREYNARYMRNLRLNDAESIRAYERTRKRKYDEKQRARSKLNFAVKSGKIEKPDACSRCKKTTKVTAHHDDYNIPLDVTWLCFQCHADIHRNIRKARDTT